MATIALLAVDSKRPNLALMKIAAHHRAQGDTVEWYTPLGVYDRLYISKIFNFTSDYAYCIGNAKEIIRGGTGYDITSELPAEIDRLQPDYSIYPDIKPRESLGFLTRGCPNKCAWCVVPTKEGGIHPYMDIDEITQQGKRPYATLMDNNILAAGDYCLEQLDKIIHGGYHIDFNQALDARLVSDINAPLLAKAKWINSYMRFGCDTPRQIKECERAMQMVLNYGYTGRFLLYTMISGNIHECVARLSHWKHTPLISKVRVHAQPYRDPNRVNRPPQWQRDLARWANQRQVWWSTEFADFSPRKNFKCSTHLNNQDLCK